MRLIVLAALLLSIVSRAHAQGVTITSVGGNTLGISAGRAAGVREGATGKACTDMTAGGRKVEVCVARFRVTGVREQSATATVIEGEAGKVTSGFRAIFDARLVPPVAEPTPRPTATPRPTPRVLSAEDLIARGDRLFDAKDWEGAAAAFRELLDRYPGHADAEYARKLLASATERAGEARAAAERERAERDRRARAGDLAAQASRFVTAGLWADAKAKAAEALALDPQNTQAQAALREADSHLGPPKQLTDAKSGVEFLLIPAGTFTMGCTPGDNECDGDEKPSHAVTLTKPYYLARTETTVSQYQACVSAGRCAAAGSGQGGGDHPVVRVSWNDAKAFCEWVEGRLPTEAEWEHAARGGRSDWRYPWGNTLTRDNANFDGRGGRDQWSGTSPMCSFTQNAFGLCDMSGNVWEWVGDWYDSGYYTKSPSQDRVGPSSGSYRVLRGGSWDYTPRGLRVSNRGDGTPDYRFDVIGFRCARTGIP